MAMIDGRPPHFWLDGGRSLYDRFGFDWTLLRLGPQAPSGEPFAGAAARLGLGLEIVGVADPAGRDLYAADFALIRPDQMVAWRGNDPAAAERVLGIAAGHGG